MKVIVKSSRRKSKKMVEGLTLVEMVLYLALFAILFFTVMQFVLSVTENNRKAMARTRVETSLLFLLEHIDESFHEIDSISEPGSVFGENSGVLSLSVLGIPRKYSVSNGRIMYEIGGVSVPLTPPDVFVTCFRLDRIENEEGVLSGIRIAIEIQSEKQDATERVESAFIL